MAIEKIKILGAVLELPAKQQRQFSPFCPFALVDDYSFDMKNIDIWAPKFFKNNNSFIATVEAKQTFNEGNKYCCQIPDVQLTLNFDLYKEFVIVSFMKWLKET